MMDGVIRESWKLMLGGTFDNECALKWVTSLKFSWLHEKVDTRALLTTSVRWNEWHRWNSRGYTRKLMLGHFWQRVCVETSDILEILALRARTLLEHYSRFALEHYSNTTRASRSNTPFYKNQTMIRSDRVLSLTCDMSLLSSTFPSNRQQQSSEHWNLQRKRTSRDLFLIVASSPNSKVPEQVSNSDTKMHSQKVCMTR